MRRSEYRSVRLRGYMRNGATEADEEIRSSCGSAANTEVKLFGADGSWGLSPCESRTLPGKRKEKFSAAALGFFVVLRYGKNTCNYRGKKKEGLLHHDVNEVQIGQIKEVR